MRIRKAAAISSLAVLLIAWSACAGCSIRQKEGFAVYLTKDDIPPAQMEALSHVDLSPEPVFTAKDILSYNAVTHEIELKEAALKRIADLDVPVRGKSFLVCIDKAPIYWGAFWVMLSSISFDGVTILKPIGAQENTSITLALGYPSGAFYTGEDPRDDAGVMKSLELAGKLINKP